MITRIELTNFMSHAHTVIEPAAGLTVLVGPNNVGKSAVVAALQILCHNENSTYVLRHGAKECSVKVETDDGHRIEWRRKNSPSYVIDGQTFDRLKGSGLPDELHRALRLPKVDAGSDADFDVHFGIQKAPIFLLGSSPGNAAKFFASSSDVSRLIEIQKRHKEKLAEAQREKVRLDGESKQLDAELGLLEPAIELDRRLELVEATHAELRSDAARLAAAELCAAELRVRAQQFARHAAEVAATTPLQPPPELPATEPLEQLIEALRGAERKHGVVAGLLTALAKLNEPPTLCDVAQPAQLIETLSALGTRVAQDEG
ncbi:MAG: AAA family ATPase, partial [Planctomycetaceae bacterium]|nr:AAA family ATPase [Planctomycetaceae bacterium]